MVVQTMQRALVVQVETPPAVDADIVARRAGSAPPLAAGASLRHVAEDLGERTR